MARGITDIKQRTLRLLEAFIVFTAFLGTFTAFGIVRNTFYALQRSFLNVVGYQEQASRQGNNYVTPTFIKVGGGLLTAQDLQLQEGLNAADANIMFRDYRGITGEAYTWYPKSYFEGSLASRQFTDDTYTELFKVPEGKNGVWARENDNADRNPGKRKYWYELLDKEFAPADAVQIYTKEANTKMTTSGEVPNENVFVSSIAGCNYIGNPYPVAITCQDIQLQEGLNVADANIMFRDYRGITGEAYTWYPKSYFEGSLASRQFTDDTYTELFKVPEGKNGVWARENDNADRNPGKRKYWYELLDKELKAGEGIQLYTKDAKTEITVLCPYDL